MDLNDKEHAQREFQELRNAILSSKMHREMRKPGLWKKSNRARVGLLSQSEKKDQCCTKAEKINTNDSNNDTRTLASCQVKTKYLSEL